MIIIEHMWKRHVVGISRSLGKYSLEEFQEIKQINIRLNVEPNGWFPTN